MATATGTSKFDTFLSEKYIPLEIKTKILLAILAFVLPVVLFYFLLFTPKQKTITGLENQKVALIAEVNKARMAADNLQQYKEKVAEAQKRFEKIAEVLPKKKEIPNLLRSISDLGKGAGLDFLSFKPGGEVPKDFYAEIPVNISIRGPYHNMGYFLDQISKLDRLVTVDNINMGSPDQVRNEVLLNSSCRLLTYRFTNTKLPTADK